MHAIKQPNVVEFIRQKDPLNEPANDPVVFTPDEMAHTLRGYVGIQHVVMVVLIIAVMMLGMNIAWQGHVIKQKDLQIAQLEKSLDEVTAENARLRELTAPVQKKIDLGAMFIHRNYHRPIAEARRLARSEMVNSLKSGIAFSVGLAISSKESGFRSWIASYNDTSHGIKQIHFNVWRKEIPGLTLQDLYNPETNIALGYGILKQYKERYGSLSTAIERYYGSTVPEENYAYRHDVVERASRIARYLAHA